MSCRKNTLVRYIKTEGWCAALVLSVSLIFSLICAAWEYDFRSVLYGFVLSSVLSFSIFLVRYFLFRARIKALGGIIGDFDTARERFPRGRADSPEREWRMIAEGLLDELREREAEEEKKLSDEEEYFTAWAHQVKIPISAMRLIIGGEYADMRRDMSAEITKVEQYADMIMAYVRLESEFTDYVFREVSLDCVIKNVLRKYSVMFIRKKLTLKYESTDARVTGDEKQITFILEQLVSNAVKYTPRGEIEIAVTDGNRISVSDTGIGIPAEDLPRIFEKGYTGLNGRADTRASGIGLYLTKRICDRLGYGVSAISTVGLGSTFTLDLSRDETEMND